MKICVIRKTDDTSEKRLGAASSSQVQSTESWGLPAAPLRGGNTLGSVMGLTTRSTHSPAGKAENPLPGWEGVWGLP